MSDWIEREEAVMALRLEYPMMPFFKESREEWAIKTEGYRKAEEVIMKLPSVKSMEMVGEDRPKGEWIAIGAVCEVICKHCIKANGYCQHHWKCPLLTEIAELIEPKDEPQTEREGE